MENLCEQHSLPIIAYSQNEERKIALCSICIQKFTSKFEYTQEANQQFNQWFTNQFDTLNSEYVNQLKSFIQPISEIRTFINKSIDKLLSHLQDWIAASQNFKKGNETIQNFDEFINQVNKEWKSKESQFKQLIIEQISCINDCNLKKLKGMQNISLKFPPYHKNQGLFFQPANYQLLNESNIQLKQWCNSLCFNKDKNILAVGSKIDIKVFQFQNGNLTQIQKLKSHTQDINALYIGHNNQIYSCSDDSTIKVWVQQNMQEWKLQQELIGHTDWVYCMVVNQADDTIITGSKDNSIKIWIKSEEEWSCGQTLQYHSDSVMVVSLNETQNQFLSGGSDKQLNIYKCGANNEWSLAQTITADEQINRASFIGDNIIVFSQEGKGQLQIYENNQTSFVQKQEIQVKGTGQSYMFFPQVFCKQQGILIHKNCQFINIIIITKDNSFIVEQAIEFTTDRVFGTVTLDGQYLVTWDINSNQIQIRELE